jgi:methyl-accepting chemotaxis protein
MLMLRQLDINTKLYASFAILLGFSVSVSIWQLTELAQLNALAAASADAQERFAHARSWTWALLLLGMGVGTALPMWLARELARPVQEAIGLAHRIGCGDLSPPGGSRPRGTAGGLIDAMGEMNDKLAAIFVKLRSGTGMIAEGVGDIASGSLELSARTEQQAAAIEQTAASMEQFTATVKQNAEHAVQASKLAVSASEVAVKGGAVVSEVVGTMASINDSSKRIAEIIGVIDGIAFQTNILALNAAVEAARAGEQGRGFAVVAAEVRNLAQRSAAAAREIKALIDDSVDKVNAGTVLADKAGATMHEVVTSVKRVTAIIGEIAGASAEQTSGIEQVNLAIMAMDQATQANGVLVGQASTAAAAMRAQATTLGQLIATVTLSPHQSRMAVVAAKPVRAAPTPAAATRPAPTPAARAQPARPKRGVPQDADWEEF